MLNLHLPSFLPRHVYYAVIPAHENAALEQPRACPNGRWPTIVFSHGLGGSRNSYSFMAGSLASHGLVVLCPEHRDGSAVSSLIRVPGSDEQPLASRRAVPYRRISHVVSPELYEAREAQLRVRLWELGLAHQALLAMDKGARLDNLTPSAPSLSQFAGRLDVNEPGRIVFGGHSFGATATYQFLKSTYYASVPEVGAAEKPLFALRPDSAIRKQVTEKTVAMLLDMWCLPLLSPNSTALYNLPLPAYADLPTASGGKALLAVESEAFYKWREHLHAKARLLSPDPTAPVVSRELYERRSSGGAWPEPNFFYVTRSAHLSQSDFGILFPWLTNKFFKAEQPERALRLNLRAQLQLLRSNGISVAEASSELLLDGPRDHGWAEVGYSDDASGLDGDEAIFDRSRRVSHWTWISTVGLGAHRDVGQDGTRNDQGGEQDGNTASES